MPDQLTFADGLVGFPDLRRFAVTPIDGVPFLLLDSLDDEAFGFIAVHAEDLRGGLAAELIQASAARDDNEVIVLISVHGEPAVMTANPAGPILVDAATGDARQLVLEGDAYPLRAPVTEAV